MPGSLLADGLVHIGAFTDLRLRAGTVATARTRRNDRGMSRTVVVVDDNERFRSWACDLLAREGYVAFVADMYGEGLRPKDFGEAAALANPLREDPAEARRRTCSSCGRGSSPSSSASSSSGSSGSPTTGPSG